MEKNKTCNRPWRYSLAMFGLSIAGYMYVTYGTFFYTETIGLSMKLIALGNVLYAAVSYTHLTLPTILRV